MRRLQPLHAACFKISCKTDAHAPILQMDMPQWLCWPDQQRVAWVNTCLRELPESTRLELSRCMLLCSLC